MGVIPKVCRLCGSSYVKGRCDCVDDPVIDLVACQYCGAHATREAVAQCPCRNQRSIIWAGNHQESGNE